MPGGSSKANKTHIRPNRIGPQLPYFEFETRPESPFFGVHLLTDGSLGVCWKMPVPASYSQDQGVLITNNEFRTFVEGLPDGYECQVALTSTNNLTDRMKQYLGKQAPTERGQILRHARAEKMLEAGFNAYEVAPGGFTKLRETYLVLSLRSAPQQEVLGALTHAINALYAVSAFALQTFRLPADKLFAPFLQRLLKTTLSEFTEALQTAETTLNGMFDASRGTRMTLQELKAHYWNAYCPNYKVAKQEVTVDPLQTFSDQIFPIPLEVDYDVIRLGEDYHGLIMLAMMPDVVAPDYFGILRRTIPTQFTVFTNMKAGNQMVEKMQLSLSAALRKRVATMFSREEAEMFAQEASEVKSRMFGGRKVMYMQFGIVVHGRSRGEVENTLLRLNAQFKKLSAVPDIERTMALQGISYSWPLVWRSYYSRPFTRTRRVLSDDLVDLLPLHGHWGGHDDPQAMYTNRDGEITFFNHTSPDFVNWHYAITGTSGSGKSFVVADLALQLLAGGIQKQYLLTVKDDYDRFGETMGRLVIIDLDRQDVCINPYAGDISKHRIQQWATSLELMLRRGGEITLERDEARLAEQIVQYAYELVPEDDVLRPTWIREAFHKFPYVSAEQRKLGFQSAEIIGSYCKEGIYGGLFDGPPVVSEKDRIVVFNLQNVLSETISDVIINAIFTMLDNVMYLGDRGERKHLLVDEMISMVSSKGGQAVANQLKRAFRTYRSLNCMCGISTQNEEDLTTEVGQAIIGNITKRMILKPRREMIPTLMQSLGLKNERHEAYVASVDTKPGYYSEFYLMSPHGEVVCRLIADRLTYALATTTPDDVSEITRLKNEFSGDWWQAALKFSQLYPNGVRAARAQEEE